MIDPLVSVIVPAYQSQETLAYCLQSIVKQEYQNLEIIVVNNGSTDKTKDIITEFSKADTRIRPVYLPINRRPAGGRNVGIREASGEYIAFLDSDDEWFPEKIRIQVDHLKKNPNIDLLFTDANVFTNGKSTRTFSLGLNARANDGLKEVDQRLYELLCPRVSILTDIPVCLSSIICKSDVLRDVNGFNESLTVTDDIDLWLRIAVNHKFFYLDEVMVNRYRIPAGATSHAFEYLNRLLNYYESILQNNDYSDIREQIKRNMRGIYKKQIIFQTERWCPGKAIISFIESRRYFNNELLFYAVCSFFGPIPIIIKRNVINRIRKLNSK